MGQGEVSYLHIYLEPFSEFLQRDDVTDVYVNRPGEVWIETLGGAAERFDMPQLTDAHLWRLARQVASISHQGISREHPLLAATLPTGARVQIVAPPATRGPMAIAIRKHVVADLSLDQLHDLGSFTTTRSSDEADPLDAKLQQFYEAHDWRAFLKAAVRARKTIVISGGTSTGKTTFLNALVQEIDPLERLILIEDTPEMLLRHDNAVGLIAARGEMGEARVDANDLLIASLRMRPDRVILGELRGQEAFTFLRAINIGHPGSLTTLHADSPTGAIEQLALLVLQSGVALHRDDIAAFAEAAVDIFVQLERHNGKRSVAQVRWNPTVVRHPSGAIEAKLPR